MPERKKRTYDFSLPAYSSDGKQDFRHKLTIIFDFTDHDRSIRKVRDEVAYINEEARKLARKIKNTDRGFGIYISANQVGSRNAEGNQVLRFELPRSGPELSARIAPFLQTIGKEGKELMLSKYITRRETGLMRRSVGYMQRRRGNNQASVEIGWVRRWYKYFGYQEMGTKTISPMAGIIRTKLEMEQKGGVVNKAYNEFFRKEFLERGGNN